MPKLAKQLLVVSITWGTSVGNISIFVTDVSFTVWIKEFMHLIKSSILAIFLYKRPHRSFILTQGMMQLPKREEKFELSCTISSKVSKAIFQVSRNIFLALQSFYEKKDYFHFLFFQWESICIYIYIYIYICASAYFSVSFIKSTIISLQKLGLGLM